MNVEDYINMASEAMRLQTDHSYYRYSLVISAGKLICIASPGMKKGEVFIYGITRHQLQHGLDSGGWSRMGDKVMKVMKELRL